MTETITKTDSLLEKPATIASLRAGILSGAVKATELTEHYYARIAAHNPLLNVYLALTREQAMEQAASVDAAAAKGEELGPLAGIPVGIKRTCWSCRVLPQLPARPS